MNCPTGWSGTSASDLVLPLPQPRLSSAELDQEAKRGDDLELERKGRVRPLEGRVFKVRHENPAWFGPMSVNAKRLRAYL
jgi:hypothetical protein